MVVSSVYFARSSTGTGVAVNVGVNVTVGGGVIVAVGVTDAVGVAVDAGEKDEQETKKERRKRERNFCEKVVLFRMGCILPLVLIEIANWVAGVLKQKPPADSASQEGSPIDLLRKSFFCHREPGKKVLKDLPMASVCSSAC